MRPTRNRPRDDFLVGDETAMAQRSESCFEKNVRKPHFREREGKKRLPGNLEGANAREHRHVLGQERVCAGLDGKELCRLSVPSRRLHGWVLDRAPFLFWLGRAIEIVRHALCAGGEDGGTGLELRFFRRTLVVNRRCLVRNVFLAFCGGLLFPVACFVAGCLRLAETFFRVSFSVGCGRVVGGKHR
jgi:hypothetical protein